MAIVRIDSIRSKAYGSITGSYTTVGSALTHNWRMWCITNNTDGDMMFSLNGSTDNVFVPAYSFRLYDLSTNAANVQDTDGFQMQIGSQFSVKYISAPTQGTVYIEGVYSR